jgi:hypothetical protein
MKIATIYCDEAYDDIKMHLTEFHRQTALNFVPFVEITSFESVPSGVAYSNT